MIEVAISLAIIGIALVGIIGVLPIGLRTQEANREESLINQDATVFMEDIRNGVKGADDLTNYVYAITNTWVEYNSPSYSIVTKGANGYTYSSASVAIGFWASAGGLNKPINCGTNIIGLLTTPEYQGPDGSPNLPASGNFYSNHVVAYVYSISGPAVEKPPQPYNSLVRQSSFAYRLICENVPMPTAQADTLLGSALSANLFELRLFFRWPQEPNGDLGFGAQSYRTMIAGQMAPDFFQTNLLFFQPQSFNNPAGAQ